MIKNVIYSRVSSESERQDTERQTKELQEYARTMNYEVVEVSKKRQVDSKRTIKDQGFQKCWNCLSSSFYWSSYFSYYLLFQDLIKS